jgi:hypothetical protein
MAPRRVARQLLVLLALAAAQVMAIQPFKSTLP